jgi:hypothetical protein
MQPNVAGIPLELGEDNRDSAFQTHRFQLVCRIACCLCPCGDCIEAAMAKKWQDKKMRKGSVHISDIAPLLTEQHWGQ